MMPPLPSPRNAALRATLLLGAIAWGVGCGERSEPTAAPAPPDGGERRLVTLAPAITQMLVDLGHADELVGVTDKDTAAPPGLPVVGNYVDLDTERLLSVRPTHVLQMVSRGGVSPGLATMAAETGFDVVAFPYPNSLTGVLDILHGGGAGGGGSLGELLGDPDAALAVREAMQRFFSELEALTADGPRPRVLLAIGTDPLMASGPGTVHDELLGYAGGVNTAADASVTAPTYDREALLTMNPQVVLILSPGRENTDADAMAALVPELLRLPVEAVQEGRVVLINDPATLLPSTSLPRIAAIMARAIHPERTDEVAALLADYERVLAEEAGRATTRR